MPTLRTILTRLRKAALAYPEAAEDFPWEHRVFKVRGKIFAFLDVEDGALHVTAKLPRTGEAALLLPMARPASHNLGKSGWVSVELRAADGVPEPLVLEWIDESYRAIAPAALVRQLVTPDACERPRATRQRSARRGRRGEP